MAIRDWSTTAGDNDDADSNINWLEGQAPSTVNNSARALMAAIRTQFNINEWFDYGDGAARKDGQNFSLTGTHTTTYHVGRRVRISDTNAVQYGTVSAVTFSSGTQVTVVFDSGSLTATVTGVALGSPAVNPALPDSAAARSAMGLAIGSDVQAHGDVLDDLNTLGAASSDGEVIVATGAGAFAYESGDTLRTSIMGAIGPDLNTLGAVSSDGQFIVGTGSGVFAYESGATARTSLGLTIGTNVQAQGAVLDDLNTLGANSADSEFLVGTGSGALAWESGATARTSLGVTSFNPDGAVVFNESGADVDFRIESDTNTNAFMLDSSLFGGVGAIGIGRAANATIGILMGPGTAQTAIADNVISLVGIMGGGGATTIPTGTAANVSSLEVQEPNITATGTVTVASTVRIKDAPTEGTFNYALLVDDGLVHFNDRLHIGDARPSDANMTKGVAVDQGGADNYAYAGFSSDISHGLTDLQANSVNAVDDQFYGIRKENAIRGGVKIVAYHESTQASGHALSLAAFGDGGQLTATSAYNNGEGGIELKYYGHDDANGLETLAANGKVFAVWAADIAGGGGRRLFSIDEDGDFKYDGADGGAWDQFDDTMLLRDLQMVMHDRFTKKGKAESHGKTSHITPSGIDPTDIAECEARLGETGVIYQPTAEDRAMAPGYHIRENRGMIDDNGNSAEDLWDDFAALPRVINVTKLEAAIAAGRFNAAEMQKARDDTEGHISGGLLNKLQTGAHVQSLERQLCAIDCTNEAMEQIIDTIEGIVSHLGAPELLPGSRIKGTKARITGELANRGQPTLPPRRPMPLVGPRQ